LACVTREGENYDIVVRQSAHTREGLRRTIDAWADAGDLSATLEAVRARRLGFWDAMLWASAQRADRYIAELGKSVQRQDAPGCSPHCARDEVTRRIIFTSDIAAVA
jgi:hypothetical protein